MFQKTKYDWESKRQLVQYMIFEQQLSWRPTSRADPGIRATKSQRTVDTTKYILNNVFHRARSQRHAAFLTNIIHYAKFNVACHRNK